MTTRVATPAAARPLLEGVKAKLGSAPNLFRVIANSPAALEGYLSLGGALGKGSLDPRGHVSDADDSAVKLAGYTDADIVKIVLHVALSTLANYVNEVARTEIDFPVVKARSAA